MQTNQSEHHTCSFLQSTHRDTDLHRSSNIPRSIVHSFFWAVVLFNPKNHLLLAGKRIKGNTENSALKISNIHTAHIEGTCLKHNGDVFLYPLKRTLSIKLPVKNFFGLRNWILICFALSARVAGGKKQRKQANVKLGRRRNKESSQTVV